MVTSPVNYRNLRPIGKGKMGGTSGRQREGSGRERIMEVKGVADQIWEEIG